MTQIRIRSMLNQIRLTQTIQDAEPKQFFSHNPHDSQILETKKGIGFESQNYLETKYKSFTHDINDSHSRINEKHLDIDFQTSKEVSDLPQKQKPTRRGRFSARNYSFLFPLKVKSNPQNLEELGIAKKCLSSRETKQRHFKSVEQQKLYKSARMNKEKQVGNIAYLTMEVHLPQKLDKPLKKVEVQTQKRSQTVFKIKRPSIRSADKIKAIPNIDKKFNQANLPQDICPWDNIRDSTSAWLP